MNTKILVCCHKDDLMASNPPYLPIHVGKSIATATLPIVGDDTGDNISHKNKFYSELTGIYWAWKNMPDADIIGVCHYRRYFDFHHQVGYPHTDISIDKFGQTNLNVPNNILRKVARGDVVVASPRYLRETVELQYCFSHDSNDYHILKDVIEQHSSSAIHHAFRSVVHSGCTFHPYNMFIMRKQDFDDYCSWLFETLRLVEQETGLPQRDVYQNRVFGFMSERLLKVWLVAKKKHVIERPVICFNERPSAKGHFYCSYKLSGWRRKFGLLLMRM